MDLFDTIGPAESAAGSAQVADNFTPDRGLFMGGTVDGAIARSPVERRRP
jgi:hypothetical protein